MAYLLRALLALMVIAVALTVLAAFGHEVFSYSHIELAIPSYLFVIFTQAFIMFYFIGVSRLTNNIYAVLKSEGNLEELFDNPPEDLSPYLKKTEKFVYDSTVSKRKTIPWSMLMVFLGMIAFLLGGAVDTGMLDRIFHSGVVYGFLGAMIIGFFHQWKYLGQTHILLRKLKALYEIPDAQM